MSGQIIYRSGNTYTLRKKNWRNEKLNTREFADDSETF